MKADDYSNQVFINCPFDDEYKLLFRGITFCAVDCGFVPRCALEVRATHNRLGFIIAIIQSCKYGVHDLCRVELSEHGLPRFNMPLELGIFFGAQFIGDGNQKSKSCLVLEKQKYRYQKFISDLSGMDVHQHRGNARDAIVGVRNWLASSSGRAGILDGEEIARRFAEFENVYHEVCRDRGIDVSGRPFVDLTRDISDWLTLNPVVRRSLFE